MRSWLKSFLVMMAAMVSLAFGVAGCASAPSTRSETAVTVEAIQAEYRLGPGDRLRVIVFQQEDLTGEFLVDGTGAVAFPLIGKVDARGRTIREFEKAVEARLKDGYLSDPRVSAEMLNFRPYYILGEVVKSGEYPYQDGMTVMKAVATAEGFTYRADKRKVFIKRADEPIERAFKLDSSTTVLPGDTVRIPERLF